MLFGNWRGGLEAGGLWVHMAVLAELNSPAILLGFILAIILILIA